MSMSKPKSLFWDLTHNCLAHPLLVLDWLPLVGARLHPVAGAVPRLDRQ